LATFAHLSGKLIVRADEVMTLTFVPFFSFLSIYSAILFANLPTFVVLGKGLTYSATRLEKDIY